MNTVQRCPTRYRGSLVLIGNLGACDMLEQRHLGGQPGVGSGKLELDQLVLSALGSGRVCHLLQHKDRGRHSLARADLWHEDNLAGGWVHLWY